ncbi:hypothetical protein BDK51DRAFT_39300 [Blyttiomyces helicus]|uniref:Uncharacterized protein n=1 Tax=Blyttiomyces helicus TaxID=388810 RepID=A0A4P9WBF8_9FUNG|nr:hypothetical protein BDK51DRAFT_39300 [Blyttiomyces helicus]|eukprot:RKO88250.1 hypothetical protein BDK51DRAFT_39300 [Blyttiomyces helicus]
MFCTGQGGEVVAAVWVTDGLLVQEAACANCPVYGASSIENVTDSKPMAHRAPKTCAATPPCKKAPAKKAPHSNPPAKHTVPSTPSRKKALFKKAPVKTNPADITVKGKACKNLAWTDDMIIKQCPGKRSMKSVLETWKELVEDDDDPGTRWFETKHLVNERATIRKDSKVYIQNGGTTKSGMAAIPEPKYFNLYMGTSLANMEFFGGEGEGVAIINLACSATGFLTDAMVMQFLDPSTTKISSISRGAVAQDEPVFGADKESEVEEEDCENYTAEDDDEDEIFDYEIKGDYEPCGTTDHPPLLELQPTTETTLDDILRVCYFWRGPLLEQGSYEEQDKTIAVAKRKAKEQPTPVEDAYTLDRRLKKMKPTDLDTGAIKADQQSAWYKRIQPAGIDSTNRAIPMGGASEQPWYIKLLPPALLCLNSSPALSPL